ncbi:MAG: fructose-6-phosphate aldolase [Spirochaetales bacterium]|nr:fructose-6-phosphate aldolase [Spirochaetales bacterium]
MKLFIDTAMIDEIKEAWSWGIVDGVTTNPTHVAASGKKFLTVIEEICAVVDGPISAEAVSLDAEGIIKEAREISKIHKNIVVKVPVIREGFKAVKKLTEMGIKTNMTLNYSASQALLAAKVGAAYISPFVGRLDYINQEGMELVRQIRQIYCNYGYKTEIIVAAIRHPEHVLQSALIGADVCTMRFDIMKMLFDHPMTDIGLEQFLKDWEKVPK